MLSHTLWLSIHYRSGRGDAQKRESCEELAQKTSIRALASFSPGWYCVRLLWILALQLLAPQSKNTCLAVQIPKITLLVILIQTLKVGIKRQGEKEELLS